MTPAKVLRHSAKRVKPMSELLKKRIIKLAGMPEKLSFPNAFETSVGLVVGLVFRCVTQIFSKHRHQDFVQATLANKVLLIWQQSRKCSRPSVFLGTAYATSVFLDFAVGGDSVDETLMGRGRVTGWRLCLLSKFQTCELALNVNDGLLVVEPLSDLCKEGIS